MYSRLFASCYRRTTCCFWYGAELRTKRDQAVRRESETHRRIYAGDVLVAVYSSQLESVRELADAYNVRFIPLAHGSLKWAVYMSRFELYLQWTFFFADTDILLTSDVRDTFFQADPFAEHFLASLRSLNMFGEPKMIGQCPYNRNWIKMCWGDAAVKELAKNTIICSGSIMGEAWALRSLFRDMISLAASVPHCVNRGGIQCSIICTTVVCREVGSG